MPCFTSEQANWNFYVCMLFTFFMVTSHDAIGIGGVGGGGGGGWGGCGGDGVWGVGGI